MEDGAEATLKLAVVIFTSTEEEEEEEALVTINVFTINQSLIKNIDITNLPHYYHHHQCSFIIIIFKHHSLHYLVIHSYVTFCK